MRPPERVSATQGGAAIAGSGAYTSGGTFTRTNVGDAFDSTEGFTLDFNLSLKPWRSSSNGLYDMRFVDLTDRVIEQMGLRKAPRDCTARELLDLRIALLTHVRRKQERVLHQHERPGPAAG